MNPAEDSDSDNAERSPPDPIEPAEADVVRAAVRAVRGGIARHLGG